jgi:hypothetical protein
MPPSAETPGASANTYNAADELENKQPNNQSNNNKASKTNTNHKNQEPNPNT